VNAPARGVRAGAARVRARPARALGPGWPLPAEREHHDPFPLDPEARPSGRGRDAGEAWRGIGGLRPPPAPGHGSGNAGPAVGVRAGGGLARPLRSSAGGPRPRADGARATAAPPSDPETAAKEVAHVG